MPAGYTLVVGVDRRHLLQLSWTWPTWIKHKPSLLKHPILVFHDTSVDKTEIQAVVKHPWLKTAEWGTGLDYGKEGKDKWSSPQRYKMLAGFVHLPGQLVETEYWLKLDTDVVATGQDDWIDPKWFSSRPAIISHRWTFTKPADQMLRLDKWAKDKQVYFPGPPLNLIPKPGADRLGHKRIISWCAFFDTDFTRRAGDLASSTCGAGMLPVQSQDGYLWYLAKRRHSGTYAVNMKSRGWQQWSTEPNIVKYAQKALGIVSLYG